VRRHFENGRGILKLTLTERVLRLLGACVQRTDAGQSSRRGSAHGWGQIRASPGSSVSMNEASQLTSASDMGGKPEIGGGISPA